MLIVVFLALGLLVYGQNCSLKPAEMASSVSFEALKQLPKFDEASLNSMQPRDGWFRLMAVVDHRCLSEKTDPSELLSRKISDPAKDLSEVTVFAYSLSVQTREEINSLKVQALNDPCLIHLTEDEEVKKMLVPNPPNDPLWSTQRNMATIEASPAWNVFFNPLSGIAANVEVLVGVIDTGVYSEHDDLKNNLWVNNLEVNGITGFDDDGNGYIDDFRGWDCVFNDSVVDDFDGHGTHVAGIIGAQVNNGKGIAGVMGRSIKIVPFKIIDERVAGASSCLFNGINYMVQKRVKVINLSLGSTQYLESVKQALKNAVNNGVFVAAAAGNDGKLVGIEISQYPGAYSFEIPGLMNVGSIDSNTALKSSFSNYSPMYVDIAAPGGDENTIGIASLGTVSTASYERKRGTSMSTPHVAGAAALAIGLIRSRGYPWPTPAQVEDVLQTSAPSEPSLLGYFKGGKSLDLLSLANYVDQGYPDLASSQNKNCLSLSNFDCDLFNLINTQRAAASVASLQLSNKCNAASESHVTDMIQNGYFAQSGPSESVEQRFTRFGLSGSSAGMLIAYNYQTPNEVLSQYLNSTKGHKELLLDGVYRYIGLFSAKDIDGRTFVSICFSQNN